MSIATLRREIQDKPILSAFLAAGTGFLLAGGLLTPLSRRLFRKGAVIGAQAVGIPLLVGAITRTICVRPLRLE